MLPKVDITPISKSSTTKDTEVGDMTLSLPADTSSTDMDQYLPWARLRLGLFNEMHFMSGIVESGNVGLWARLLSLLQDPEVRMAQNLLRVIDIKIRDDCGHLE
jgi:hypothetical protein